MPIYRDRIEAARAAYLAAREALDAAQMAYTLASRAYDAVYALFLECLTLKAEE